MQPHTHPTLDPNDATLRLGSAAGVIARALIAAAAGGGVAWYFGRGIVNTPTLVYYGFSPIFYHAYLLAFVFYLTITLGSLFFVMLHHLARSGWSVTVRRLAEALCANVFLMAVLFVPIYYNLGKVYVWADNGVGRTSEPVEGNVDHQNPTRQQGEQSPAWLARRASMAAENEHGAVIGHAAWLTPRAFLGRFVICFVIWGFLAWYLRGHSILQDRTGNIGLTRSMERISAPGMILFAITITSAAIDLIMSLNPHWYSTMIGVYLFADAVLSGLAAVALLALVLQSRGLLRGAVTVEHYHDLGKLTFAFVFFWGYIAFSQYMLIWYANIPEETQFFMPRQIGPWVGVSLALIVVHFAIPFAGLMSRHAKRTLPVLAFWLVWVLAAHAFDLFWLIMPNTYVRQLLLEQSAGGSLPDVFKTLLQSQQSVYQLSPMCRPFMEKVTAPLTPAAIATVVGLLVFMGGLYVANTAWLLGRARLLPVKDPRLDESLSFHNA